jgi:hypothetical protein
MAMAVSKPGGKDTRFKPGQSGNPGGKPKAIIEVAQAAREKTASAIETLNTIMIDPKATASARVSAAVAILERGWGKAPQTIDLRRTTELGNLTDDELIAIAAGDVAAPNGGGIAPATAESKSKPH